MSRIVHFVGFRDDRYWSAVRVWGRPHYIHRGWDLRARREIDEIDIVVFADGPYDQAPRVKSYNDLDEPMP
jgi:hypothetical protein